jgi:aminopeptidase N
MRPWLATVLLAGCAGGGTDTPARSAGMEPARPMVSVSAAPPNEPAPIEPGRAAPSGRYDDGVDIDHYDIEVALPRGNGWIWGRTGIDLAVDGTVGRVYLDFTGLHVDDVRVDDRSVDWTLDAGLLHVPLSDATVGSTHRVEVTYRGVPDDGLILGETVHGDPSAFVDNWPNRTRFWLPSVDHPSDKATARFTVHAPAEWMVIANGRAVGQPVPTATGAPGPDVGARRTWIYETDVDHPTYTLVVGGAEMVVDTVGLAACGDAPASSRADGCIAVTTWLFPESAEVGAASFRRAADMVDVFTEMFGPFPYEKLANVQSATRFGGMENSSAIFYAQGDIAAGRNIEGTVSHEIVHQWFGDSVTEVDWDELWLSEGFATYFGTVYFERADGVESFRERMANAAATYLTSPDTLRPVIDRRSDLFGMLNRNSYQKGGWVLHMLRREIGDDPFFDAVRAYYAEHRDATATTRDFRTAAEAAAGRDLEGFFDQWLRAPGYPVLSVDTEPTADGLRVSVEQVQGAYAPRFDIPVDLEVTWDGGTHRETIRLAGTSGSVVVPGAPAGARVEVDPDGWLLHRLHRSAPGP